MATYTIRLHRVLRAKPERVYRAFLDPDAKVKWLPPNGFTGKVHHLDAKVGGTFKMSFTNFTTGQNNELANILFCWPPILADDFRPAPSQPSHRPVGGALEILAFREDSSAGFRHPHGERSRWSVDPQYIGRVHAPSSKWQPRGRGVRVPEVPNQASC